MPYLFIVYFLSYFRKLLDYYIVYFNFFLKYFILFIKRLQLLDSFKKNMNL